MYEKYFKVIGFNSAKTESKSMYVLVREVVVTDISWYVTDSPGKLEGIITLCVYNLQ